MALYGEVKINEYVVGKWEAVRSYEITMVKDSGQRFLYNCLWVRNSTCHKFTLDHFYNDGAEVLAAKVLAHIAEHFPNKREGAEHE